MDDKAHQRSWRVPSRDQRPAQFVARLKGLKRPRPGTVLPLALQILEQCMAEYCSEPTSRLQSVEHFNVSLSKERAENAHRECLIMISLDYGIDMAR